MEVGKPISTVKLRTICKPWLARKDGLVGLDRDAVPETSTYRFPHCD